MSGTIAQVTQSATLGSAALNFSGTERFSETEDQNTDGLVVPDKALTGSYSAVSNGRIVIKPSDSTLPIIYLVSPARAFLLDLSAFNPVVTLLNQQDGMR